MGGDVGAGDGAAGMSDLVKASPGSWNRSAASFSEAGSAVSATLGDLLAATTDPTACNAAEGLATVDGAVATMLTVFGSVMQDNVITPLTEGLSEEAAAMIATGFSLQEMEDQAESSARGIWQ